MYNPDKPMVGNNILDDISAIRTNLNELRKEELATTFPTNSVAGQPCTKLEKRDDDGVTDKVVVYRRDASNTEWVKVWDEEYPNSADFYKNNDIDTDGDGVVDNADVADKALYANDADASTYKGYDIDTDGDGVVDNAENATSALNAYSANKIEGLTLGQERFTVSSNPGESKVINAGGATSIQRIVVSVPAGKTLKLKRVRFDCVNTDLRLRVADGSNNAKWTSSSYQGEETPNTVIYSNSSGSAVNFNLWIAAYNPTGDNTTLWAWAGYWLDFSIE